MDSVSGLPHVHDTMPTRSGQWMYDFAGNAVVLLTNHAAYGHCTWAYCCLYAAAAVCEPVLK